MLSHTTGAKYKRPWTRKRRATLELFKVACWLLVAFGVLSLVPFVQSAELGANCASQIVSAAFGN